MKYSFIRERYERYERYVKTLNNSCQEKFVQNAHFFDFFQNKL